MANGYKPLSQATKEELLAEIIEYEQSRMRVMAKETLLQYVIRIRTTNLQMSLIQEAGLDDGGISPMFGGVL